MEPHDRRTYTNYIYNRKNYRKYSLIMKIVNKIFNWYFGRNALPYWCIILFDLAACFFGGLFVMWLRHPASEMMAHWSTLLHTFLMFALFNLIGFRAFHTYSGIDRKSVV